MQEAVCEGITGAEEGQDLTGAYSLLVTGCGGNCC